MKRLLIAILIVSMVQGVFAQKIEIKGTIRNATDNEATEFVNCSTTNHRLCLCKWCVYQQ